MVDFGRISSIGEPSVLFENDYAVVVNKPRGWRTHERARERGPSLARWLLLHRTGIGTEELQDDEERAASVLRPGVVHRLDAETTGVLILAKTPEAYKFFKRQFRERTVRKEYFALVWGRMAEVRGSISFPIARVRGHPTKRRALRLRKEASGGRQRSAHTEWVRIAEGVISGRPVSLLRVVPLTGRTHQIRVHFEAIGRPIVGDPLYRQGAPKESPALPLALHAWRLAIRLPRQREVSVFSAPLPPDWPSASGIDLASLAQEA